MELSIEEVYKLFTEDAEPGRGGGGEGGVS